MPASILGLTGTLALSTLFVVGYLLVESATGALAAYVAVPFGVALLAQLLAATGRRLAREEERLAQALEENRRLQQTQEELAIQHERQRIAQEMHDGLGQTVYMLSLNLEAAADTARDDDRLRSQLAMLAGLARRVLLEVRQYIFDLQPLLDEKGDVSSALRSQASEFSAVSGLPVRIEIEGEEGKLSIGQRAALYRVTQEALANVFRHSQASNASVRLSFGEREVVLEITDDGVGINGDASNGHGLRNIKDRVEALRGTSRVVSAPGGGTSVRAVLPRTQ
jgi:signal transduction histidine kinase